jgi:MOSC domain-containing protein YiiM
MDLSFRHDLWIARLPRSPLDGGTVERCVVRRGTGERDTPDAVHVSPEGGVEGDRWAADAHARAGNQVSLVNVHVLRALTDGDPRRMALSGDNLQVDLDLSEANLPVGTRLAIGDALLEVTPDPHRPCRSFAERYGAIGAKRVTRANRKGLRGRGVLARVVRGGTVRVGDRISVERPAPGI